MALQARWLHHSISPAAIHTSPPDLLIGTASCCCGAVPFAPPSPSLIPPWPQLQQQQPQAQPQLPLLPPQPQPLLLPQPLPQPPGAKLLLLLMGPLPQPPGALLICYCLSPCLSPQGLSCSAPAGPAASLRLSFLHSHSSRTCRHYCPCLHLRPFPQSLCCCC